VFLRNKKGFNINIVVDYQGNNTNLNLAFDENNYQNFI
jgi:hypothetical protein